MIVPRPIPIVPIPSPSHRTPPLAAARSTIVALVSGFGWHVQDLVRASKRLDVDLSPVRFSTLSGRVAHREGIVASGGRELSEVDGILVRMMPPGSLEQVIFRMDALNRLEHEGVRILNSPRAVEVSVDKYLSLSMIASAGIPVPGTFVCESAREALQAYEELGGDVVLKPLFGSEGRGMVRLSDPELAWRAFSAVERIGSVIYLQKAVRHPGYDYRAFVLGGRVLGAIRRRAPSGEWRTNIAVGGRPEAIVLDPALETLALAAARAVGAEMAGVDLLDDLDSNSPVVLEVNAVPGWRALAAITGIDVASSLLEHLRGQGASR